MAGAAEPRSAVGVLTSEDKRAIIAHLVGGPLDGNEIALYRARRFYTPRVRRGTVRRALRLSRRYAWYELDSTWEQEDVLHGDYRFLEVRGERAGIERAQA